MKCMNCNGEEVYKVIITSDDSLPPEQRDVYLTDKTYCFDCEIVGDYDEEDED